MAPRVSRSGTSRSAVPRSISRPLRKTSENTLRLSSRGLVYRRGSFSPGTPRRPDPDWIQIGATRAGIQVGYILQGELDGEPEARARALKNLAQRVVLDLFTPVN